MTKKYLKFLETLSDDNNIITWLEGEEYEVIYENDNTYGLPAQNGTKCGIDKKCEDKKYEKYESFYDNVSLTKHIDTTETIKEKNTPHTCAFEESGYALYGIDEYGRYVQPELKCKCGKKEYKDKEYLDNE